MAPRFNGYIKKTQWGLNCVRVDSDGPLLYQGTDALRLGENGHRWARSYALRLKTPDDSTSRDGSRRECRWQQARAG